MSDVQDSVSVGVTLWKRYLGGNRGYSQVPDGVPPSGGATDRGDGGEMWGRRRVGVPSGKVGDGLCGAPPNHSIHKEAADDHSVEGGLPSYIFIVHGGREDAGDDLDGAMVGSRRG